MGGLFGAVAKNPGQSVAEQLFFGTDYQSQRGGDYAGLAGSTKDGERPRRIHTLDGQFQEKFADEYQAIDSDMGIGVISSLEEQPIYESSLNGDFFLAIDGWIANRKELKENLMRYGASFSEVGGDEVNQAELAGKIISRGKNILDGIELAYQEIEGSLSLLLANEEEIYLAGDRFPLAIGENEDSYAVASETCAFPNLGYEISEFPQPGEIYKINHDGVRLVNDLDLDKNICAFLWMYTSNPTSMVEDINVEEVRIENGKILAKNDGQEFDIFSGVPESGNPHAYGFITEAIKEGKIKEIGDVLKKYTTSYGRSYTPSSQEIRDQIADNKLIPNKSLIKGKEIGIADDSIVRGTQLKNTTRKIWKAGAEDIHARIGSPPLAFPCKFNKSTREPEELIFRQAIKGIEGTWNPDNFSEFLDSDSEKYRQAIAFIEEELKLSSLKYQDIEGMEEAIGFPKEDLCEYCWLGKE